MKKVFALSALVCALLFSGCGKKRDDNVLRFGMFPNITHAQGVIAYQMTQEGRGWYEERLGVKIEWYKFNAGTMAMNSIMANALDVTYVGPNPAINTYTKSNGKEIRVIAGAADGGSGMVVNPKLGIKEPKDFKGRVIATPQYANTQDVACRAWVIANGMTVNSGSGGDVNIVPTANPEQLALFMGGKIDACWTVEPWISRLEISGGAQMFLNEPDAVTTILVSSAKTFSEKPELIKKLHAAHVELTQWINDNPEEAQRLVLKGIESLTRNKLDPEIAASSWKRITFTPKVNRVGIERFVDQCVKIGFIKERTDMAGLFPDIEKIGVQE